MPCNDCTEYECSSNTTPRPAITEESLDARTNRFIESYTSRVLDPINNGEAVFGRQHVRDYEYNDARSLWYRMDSRRNDYNLFSFFAVREAQQQLHRPVVHGCVTHDVEPHPVRDHCGDCRRLSDALCPFWRLETTAALSDGNTWSCWAEDDVSARSDAREMEMVIPSYYEQERADAMRDLVDARRAGCSNCAQYGICSTRNSTYGQHTAADLVEALAATSNGRWACYLTPPIDYIGEPNYRLEHPLAQDNPDNIPLLQCDVCEHTAPDGSAPGEIECIEDANGMMVNICVGLHERYSCYDCGSDLVDGVSTVHWFHDEPLCDSCRHDNYARCCSCGDLVHHADAFVDNGDNHYCEYCWNECDDDEYSGSSGIAGYHSQDKARVLFGEKEDYASRYRIGFELEVENPKRYSEVDSTTTVRSLFPEKFVYFEHDGSLNSGFEIITAPFTNKWLSDNEQSFVDMLKFLRTKGFRSHMTSTCGLHVHIGREAFYADSDNFDPYRLRTTAAQERWEANVAKMLYIVEKYWTTFLKLSRRNETQINSWAARYGETDHEKLKEYPKRGYTLGRYRAVNLTPSSTIELRLFRGTLKADTLLATLDLVKALVDCACEEDVTRIKNSRKLSALLGKRMTPRLRAYFETRNCL